MRNSRFLIVDDSKMVVKAVRNIVVNRLGSNQIVSAKNGVEALKVLEKHQIDFIICDWHMPEMDGLTLLGEIRNNSRLKEIPFVMMSTHGGKEAVVSAIQQGVNQYVVKPFSPQKLEDSVRKAWNSAKNRAAQRFSGLPKHNLSASFDGHDCDAQVLDLSRSGMLINLTYTSDIKLFGECAVNLDFDEIDEVAIIHIGPLPGKVLRIEAAHGFHPSTFKCEVALCFLADKTKKEPAMQLKELLNFLAEQEQAMLKAN
ncbi:MAG: response regulator [Algicola sp.]|nr:response regulator [Algicola sp.]